MKIRIAKLTTLFVLAMLVALVPGSRIARAIDNGILSGTIKDADGKPWPNITIAAQTAEGQPEHTATTDAEGKFKISGLAEGTYIVSVKQNGELIFQIRAKVAANSETPADINFKDAAVAAASAKMRKESAEASKFNNLKSHFDAGNAALGQARALEPQLKQAATPDAKAAVQAQIQPLAEKAATEFQAALPFTAEKDNNHFTITERIAESYDIGGKPEDAAKYYQQAMDLKPDAGVLNNLGNIYAKMGKLDEAKAAYEKSAEVDPAGAASAYRNFGFTLFNANKLKDAVEPLKKATQLDPTNAQAWYVLGASLVGSMGYKQEGEKITPIMEPGTVEAYQKCVDLDPNGPWGKQAKEGLDQLKAMGLGIDTKVTTKKKN
jgi:tetratricopeptide (TPR) repeat protein